jgi:hypothetical protein
VLIEPLCVLLLPRGGCARTISCQLAVPEEEGEEQEWSSGAGYESRATLATPIMRSLRETIVCTSG